MGNFYGNITLRIENRAAVLRTLGELRRNAYVVAARDHVVVYDQEELNSRRVKRLILELTKRLACVAVAVANGDDDVLAYWLAERGQLLDEYDSNPNYDTGRPTAAPSGGDAARLCGALGRPEQQGVVREILHGPAPTLEVVRHQALVEALGLPVEAVGMGFTYLAQGDAEDVGLTDILKVGDAPDP